MPAARDGADAAPPSVVESLEWPQWRSDNRQGAGMGNWNLHLRGAENVRKYSGCWHGMLRAIDSLEC